MAQEALLPFADDAHVYQTIRQVEAAVQVMEAALPFAYEDKQVDYGYQHGPAIFPFIDNTRCYIKADIILLQVALKVIDTTDQLLTVPENLLSPNNITDR